MIMVRISSIIIMLSILQSHRVEGGRCKGLCWLRCYNAELLFQSSMNMLYLWEG